MNVLRVHRLTTYIHINIRRMSRMLSVKYTHTAYYSRGFRRTKLLWLESYKDCMLCIQTLRAFLRLGDSLRQRTVPLSSPTHRSGWTGLKATWVSLVFFFWITAVRRRQWHEQGHIHSQHTSSTSVYCYILYVRSICIYRGYCSEFCRQFRCFWYVASNDLHRT